MKILVILTGGTIGSRADANVIHANEAAAYQLIHLYQNNYGTDVVFEVIQPLNILSENMNFSHWEVLLDTLSTIDFRKYDGIIITHGSDTIAYTAAMLGYCYGHTSVPIVLIASNYGLQDPRSNGLANFYNAVCFIREHTYNGVFVIFQNNQKENIVYLSTRLVEADTYLDQFSVYGGVNFGQMRNGHFIRNPHRQNPSVQELECKKNPIPLAGNHFSKKVIMIRPYPGFDYSTLHIDETVGGILHCLYHSATASSEKGNYSAAEFIRRCKEREIPVYACSFKKSQNSLYETSKELLTSGATALYHISAEAAYAKLAVACNLLKDTPEEFMKKNIYYEILPSLTEE